MSFFPDYSRINKQVMHDRDEELERDAERAAQEDEGVRATSWAGKLANAPAGS